MEKKEKSQLHLIALWNESYSRTKVSEVSDCLNTAVSAPKPKTQIGSIMIIRIRHSKLALMVNSKKIPSSPTKMVSSLKSEGVQIAAVNV